MSKLMKVFKIELKASMRKNNLNLSNFNNLVYRPHPRRKLSKKEKGFFRDELFNNSISC